MTTTTSDPLVQIFGDTAVLSHTVDTTTSVAGEQTTTRERETIVFVQDGARGVPTGPAADDTITSI